MQTGQPNLLRFASRAGKTAEDIAGLHETTFYNLQVRLAPRDGIDIGVDEVTGGANIHDGSYRRKTGDDAIISSTRNAREFFKCGRGGNFIRYKTV